MSPAHPRNQQLKMQAHHLISEKGARLSNLGDRMADFGYNINAIKNLVFIPSTLQGACLLQVQPHRGDHTAVDPVDNDEEKPAAYHVMVAMKIQRDMPGIERKCGIPGTDVKELICKAMDDLSEEIADLIQNDPREAKLSEVWANYDPESKAGCRGVDSISVKKKDLLDECPVHRNHTKNQGEGQQKENIHYVLRTPYILKPGS
ncbi:AHH domain-containing protein [Pseudoduganella lutea]|nr:AHH domain-containing protein [Pseudoduganella lutea]